MNYFQNETRQFIFTSNTGENKNAIKHNGTFNSDITFYANYLPQLGNALHSTIRVLHAQIPNAWNTINENNSTLQFNGQLISIPEGNYNANTFLAVLREELANIDPQASISLSQSTGKFTMRSINPFSINASTNSLMYKVLGMEQGTFNGLFDFGFETYTFAFQYPCNFSGTRCLYVRTSDLQLSGQHFNATNDRSVLCAIPVTVASYGILNYIGDPNSSITIDRQLSTLERLRLQILDDDGRLVDFNNLDWTLTCEIQTVLLKSRPITGPPTFADFLQKEVAQNIGEE